MPRDITSKIVRKVAIIDEDRSALEAATIMTLEYIGSVVVTGPSGITGIFSERDLIMKVVGQRKNAEEQKIGGRDDNKTDQSES